MLRREFLTGSGAIIGAVVLGNPPAEAAETPGVSATEIKIGNTMPYSGTASDYSVLGRAEARRARPWQDRECPRAARPDLRLVHRALQRPDLIESKSLLDNLGTKL